MKALNAYQVILRPLVTEKAIGSQAENTYWFAVHISAGKSQIRSAVEEVYQVHVRKVRTLRQKGKERRSRYKIYRTPDWKKAAVTLAKGERIDVI